MTDTKQTVLTDEEILRLRVGVGAGDVAFGRRIESAVLSKLRAAGEPSDDDILQTFSDACEYADRCGQGFSYGRAQALRAVISRYAAPQASTEAVRNAALEEAAKACEAVTKGFRIPEPIPATQQAWNAIALCAKAIRALKSTPVVEPEWIDDPHDNKQTVLTDEQNAIIAARFPDDPANACRAQSAIVEILSKLRAPVAQQDLWAVAESVVVEWQKAGKMPPMAWDFREFLIAGMRAYALAAEGSEKGAGDVALPPLPPYAIQTVGWDGTGIVEYFTADQMRAYALADRQQRDRGVNDQTKRLHSGAVEVCPECDIAGRRHIRARAALAAKPAASAEPSKEECWDLWQIASRSRGFLDERIHRFARELLDRYGSPALAAHKPDGGEAKDAERWHHAKANWLISHVRLNASAGMRNPDGIPWTTLEQQADAAISAQQRQGAATAHDGEAK